MDHVTSREVKHAPLEEEATPPDGEGANRVAQNVPQGDEDDPRHKVHSSEQAPSNEDWRNCGKDKLEIDDC